MSDFKGNTTFFIVGDMNARFGASVQVIPLKSSIPGIQACTYPDIPDNIPSPIIMLKYYP